MNLLIELFRYSSLLIAIIVCIAIYVAKTSPKGRARNWNTGRYSKREVAKRNSTIWLSDVVGDLK